MTDYILDVRKCDLVEKTLTLGDIFQMSKLIIAYESYVDFAKYLPEEIWMTGRQKQAYLEHLKVVADMLGLDTSKKPFPLTFRGVRITEYSEPNSNLSR